MTSDNRAPLRDYSLLFPVLVGILSLIGIGVLVAAVWFPRQETPVLPTQTLTPFKYVFLGTETATPAPKPETATASEYFPTVTSEGDISILAAPTEQSGTLSVIPLVTPTGQTGTPTGEFSTPVLTITITPDSIFAGAEPLAAGTYDATDSQIIRGGSWANHTSANAYQGTLLVSDSVGNYLAFSFVGYQMTLGYQGSDTAGNLTISIDGSEAPLTQRVGNLWFSEELAPGTHYVIITHATGASVNLDYLEIFD